MLLNVDRVAHQLQQKHGLRVDVRGVSDSGWFLDNEPFAHMECRDAKSCPPVEAIRRGLALWKGRVPEKCAELYGDKPWNCYLGYHVYPTLRCKFYS